MKAPYNIPRAIRGASTAPLTKGQKATLCILAREAFDQEQPGEDYEAWRHEQTRLACGISSLRAVQQQHYAGIKAHFLNLMGRTGEAFRQALRHETNDKRQAVAKLHVECVAAQDVIPRAMDYARGFLRSARNVTLDEASPSQVWNAIFTVRRKAQLERKKIRGGVSVADALGSVMGAITAKQARIS
jgi:hypothetical protein